MPPFLFTMSSSPSLLTRRSQYDSTRIQTLSTRLLSGLLSLPHTALNGDPSSHFPGCLNISSLKDIAVSSGSACTSASLEPSYVLRALGNSDESADSSIRFGIGRFTSEEVPRRSWIMS